MSNVDRAIALWAVACLTTAAGAQRPAAVAPPTPASVSAAARPAAISPRRAVVLTHRDAIAAGALTAAALALLPFDARIAEEFQDPAPQGSGVLRTGARLFNTLGDPGTVAVALVAFGAGRITHSTRLTDLGLHTGEAIVLGSAATGLLKGVAGRQRPFLDRADPDEFALGKGFGGNGGRASFPSGHATAAFATAAAIAEETRHWWPRAPRAVAPLLYAGAGAVALARVYDDKHWASDVVLGAAIGTLAGRVVVGSNHAHPGNRVDRWLGAGGARPAVTPVPGGAALRWRLTTR